MNNIEMILKLMEPDLTQQQLAKLKNVLQTILKSSRNAIPNEELIQRFIQHKKLVGLKDTSLMHYVLEINQLREYLGENKNLIEATTADIKDYLTWYTDKNHIQPISVQTKIRCISSFYEFLVNEEFIERNPTSKIEQIKIEKKIKKAFSYEEIEALRNACDDKRERAFIEFLYSTGARISEVIPLKVSDINFAEKECIVFGKGHKERIVYLSNICIKYLQEYLDSRYAQPDEILFSHNGNANKKMTVRGFEALLIEIGIKAGVENVHPHRFRRTMATHAMDKGMPIEQIKEVLGHSRLDTTMIYCNVNKNKVKASFKNAFDD